MPIRDRAIARAKKIKCIILDVDGVLTDGSIYVAPDGSELYKPFFARDGLIVSLARKVGVETAIVTGRASAIVTNRARELHIGLVYQGSLDKRAAYTDIKAKTGLSDEEIAYIGDDIVDLPILRMVGLPCAVGDAVPEVRDIAQIIAGVPGGRGAVREIYEIILKAQGLWDNVLTAFLQDTDDVAQ
ncbi:HAD family hydrolase [Selenomonas sp. F0473]|uniref:KdsC family phosphatase n=1 Tax=Selenomonas sp. F0473 TaxID=999423 RepID=UPI00029DDDD1|nr:HAD hydrolase family protein [Selenomonas sp. F0473]EKU72133.1 YrbI family 3-deoxy-D-manno-octulosonate 8-phosphate phosphatase [Selenomonas sp. F0473]